MSRAPTATVAPWKRPASLGVTADTYTHGLTDGRELDHGALVSELVRR